MEAEGDQVVVRANRHPHPAVTCLVRNLDCDQSMITSTSVLSLWRARRVAGAGSSGRNSQGGSDWRLWGLRASGCGHRI